MWNHARQAAWTDAEWQIRNWLYFTWLSGDHIVEQHVHNIDVANWVFNAHPIKAIGAGGRQWRTDPKYGHIYDHFAVDFEYPSGARVMSMCRQINGTAGKVDEHFLGAKGQASMSSDSPGRLTGANAWTFERTGKPVSPYVQEHTDLIASIRSGKPYNELKQVAESSLTAIMGREAAYTGQEITWDGILNADQDLTPPQIAFAALSCRRFRCPESPSWPGSGTREGAGELTQSEGSCTSTWTRSTRPWSSATTRRCAESRSRSAAIRERGVVAAASYEARAFGVRSAIPMARAVRLCPSLVIVRPDFARYKDASHAVFELFRAVTPLVEPLSLDEAYLDVTENAWGEAFGRVVAQRLKAQIREATGLTASAGVAPNKFLAKIASAWKKPDGLTVIPRNASSIFFSSCQSTRCGVSDR